MSITDKALHVAFLSNLIVKPDDRKIAILTGYATFANYP
jgi:hypothetical protein